MEKCLQTLEKGLIGILSHMLMLTVDLLILTLLVLESYSNIATVKKTSYERLQSFPDNNGAECVIVVVLIFLKSWSYLNDTVFEILGKNIYKKYYIQYIYKYG